MVENTGEARRTGPRNVDWVAVYERWRANEEADVIATAFGLTVGTVEQRCKWLDQNFPAGTRVRTAHAFARRLEEAHAALIGGEAVEAERAAKAVYALVRAARAIEDWMKIESDAAAETAAGGSESDAFDAREAVAQTGSDP
ncbi:MAG: hypothetical protein ACOC0V_01510 [Oceanicaulis sp.]